MVMEDACGSERICEKGNTILSRVAPSKRWCFTYHGGDKEFVVPILKVLSTKGIIGNELGKSGGTPHLQGFVYFKNKVRPKGFLPKEVHWEKAKGTDIDNYRYCSKESDDYTAWGYPEPIHVFEPIGWQKELVLELNESPKRRKIHWFYGPARSGKTELVKYLCVKKDALLLGSKGSDMKYAVTEWLKKRGETPRLVVLDIPYCKQEYVSYEGIEAIKNMCFFSSKYESSMVVGNIPHVVVFSNAEPDYNKMSERDWFYVKKLMVLELNDRVPHNVDIVSAVKGSAVVGLIPNPEDGIEI